jgi:hypothetical protein
MPPPVKGNATGDDFTSGRRPRPAVMRFAVPWNPSRDAATRRNVRSRCGANRNGFLVLDHARESVTPRVRLRLGQFDNVAYAKQRGHTVDPSRQFAGGHLIASRYEAVQHVDTCAADERGQSWVGKPGAPTAAVQHLHVLPRKAGSIALLARASDVRVSKCEVCNTEPELRLARSKHGPNDKVSRL